MSSVNLSINISLCFLRGICGDHDILKKCFFFSINRAFCHLLLTRAQRNESIVEETACQDQNKCIFHGFFSNSGIEYIGYVFTMNMSYERIRKNGVPSHADPKPPCEAELNLEKLYGPLTL